MQLVISCDYLISPAFCASNKLSEIVGDLIAIKREIDDGGQRVVIEKDALRKLTELSYYPCAPLFKSNIPKELRGEFAPKDIANIVRNIASATFEEACTLPECVAEWNTKEFTPILQGTSHERIDDLSQLVEDILLAVHFYQKPYSILHHPIDNGVNSVKVSGEIIESIPALLTAPPLALEEQVPVFSTYNNFLSQFDSTEMYTKAETVEQISEALFLGAAALIQITGAGHQRKFSIGESFIDSLHEHQCAPGQRFSGTAFDVICHAIAAIPKYPHNPMYKNLDSKEQRKKGAALAWRTQVTKGNPALRLMYWAEGDSIELANIGNKKDLEIL